MKGLVIYLVFLRNFKLLLYRYIIISLLITNVYTIGFQGLLIPQNGEILSNAGAGVAGNIDAALNPAMKKNKSPYIQFSTNRWLGDLSGSYTLFRWGRTIQKQVSIQTWSANDLELYGDSPQTSPLGKFGIYWSSASFSLSHNFNTKNIFGLRIQTNYSHLFTESLFGITFDVGTFIPINKLLSFAGTISNIGYEYNKTIQSSIPTSYAIGTCLKIPVLQFSVLSDILYNSTSGLEQRIALTTNKKYLNLNLGKSFSEKRNASSIGISFNYRNWKINNGIYFHENSEALGWPIFLDVRYYL
jgi:hypothetical protein